MNSGITPDGIQRLTYDYAKMGWLFRYKEGYFELASVMKNGKSKVSGEIC